MHSEFTIWDAGYFGAMIYGYDTRTTPSLTWQVYEREREKKTKQRQGKKTTKQNKPGMGKEWATE